VSPVPRIGTIRDRAQLPAARQAVWDRIATSRGHVAGPFTALLHSPEVAARTADLGAYLRFSSRLDERDRELAVLAVAREMDCRFEWAAHVPLARKAGVRETAISAIRDRSPAGLDRDEATIVTYAHQLLAAHRADEATFTALLGRLGEQSLVELTAMIGYYAMIACTLNAFEIAPDQAAEPLPP
jgi:4-carboxymuconolactone decarboxylase